MAKTLSTATRDRQTTKKKKKKPCCSWSKSEQATRQRKQKRPFAMALEKFFVGIIIVTAIVEEIYKLSCPNKKLNAYQRHCQMEDRGTAH